MKDKSLYSTLGRWKQKGDDSGDSRHMTLQRTSKISIKKKLLTKLELETKITIRSKALDIRPF